MEDNLEVVRKFLAREDLNETEVRVRDKCIQLEQAYNQTLEDVRKKERELSSLRGHLEGMITLAFELEQEKQANEKPEEENTEEEQGE